jgi:hypothetical protein
MNRRAQEARVYLMPVTDGSLADSGDVHLALCGWDEEAQQWITDLFLCCLTFAGRVAVSARVTCTPCLKKRGLYDKVLRKEISR